MTVTINKASDEAKGEKHKLPCTQCTGQTLHTVLSSIEIKGDDDQGEWSMQWHISYQLIECGGCETVSFRSVSSNSEDLVYIGPDGEQEYEEHEELYPPRVAGRRPLGDDLYYLPAKVQKIYHETVQALNIGSNILTGIGLRALIETVCKDKQASGSNLYNKIDDLTTKGLLTKTGATILHEIRTLGNNAAHEVKPHDDKTLGVAMDVVEHLLQDVYIIPLKAAKTFKKTKP